MPENSNTTAVLPEKPVIANSSDSAPEVGGNTKMQKMVRWGTKGGLAILEYGLIAGSNFVLGFLLARWMTAEQYGAYGLGFSIFLLLSFLYQALLLEPMSVYGGSNFRENLRGYMRTSLKMHNAISAVIFGAFAIAAGVTLAMGQSAALAGALGGLTIAAPCIFLFWLGRRGFYLKISPGPAAVAAALYFVLVLAGTYAINRLHILSTFSAFVVMGLAAAVCGVALLIALRRVLPPSDNVPDLKQTWRKHWSYGKWALLSSIAGWIPNYFYFTIIGVFNGIAHDGEYRALMNIAGPVLQTYAALSMLFLPFAARVHSKEGKAGAYALTWKFTELFSVGTLVYWAIVIPLRTPILHVLYKGNYSSIADYIPYFALETIIWSAGVGASIVLRAMESPRSMFIANCWASVVTLVIGIPATKYFALWGVVWSIVLSNVVGLAITLILLRRKAKEPDAAQIDFSAPVLEEQV